MNTTHTNIDIIDIDESSLIYLSEIVSKRQKHEQFMYFLKESPMTPKQNLELFKKELDTDHCMLT